MLKYMEGCFRDQPVLLSLCATVICIIAFQIKEYFRRGPKYPPGPIGLPIVGYLPFLLGSDLHLDFVKLSKKYGPIFSLKLGEIDTIVINNYEGLKDQGNKEEFTDRPPRYFQWNEEIPHMGGMSGNRWKEHRRFLMSTLRNVGMSKLKVESSIQEQISLIVEALKTQPNNVDVDIRELLAPAANNIMMSLICGKTYDAKDEMNKILTKCQFGILDYMDTIRLASFFPFLCRIFEKYSSKLKRIREELGAFEKRLTQEIKEHEQSPNQEKADYMDFFLAENKKQNPNFNLNLLLGNCQIIILGGGETVRSTVEWTLLCLARHQLLQEMIHKQIVEVIGPNRQPEYKDKDKLVLVQALILEITRYKTIGAVTDPHATSSDTELCGYQIPKGCTVLLNLWAIHNDVDHWGDPENFRPERFLSKDFKSLVNTERVVAFGMGKRNCPGEKIADVEVFLILSSLLQKFRFLPSEKGVCLDEMTVFNQMVISPLVRVEPR